MKRLLNLNVALFAVCSLLMMGCNQSASPTFQSPKIVVSPSNSESNYTDTITKAIIDTAAVEDVAAWHVEHDVSAIQGLGSRKPLLEKRTRFIVDQGTRTAGQAFLNAIEEHFEADGEPSYSFDRSKLVGIDPEKLHRWAAIALTFLEIAEPFVPPPYNLGVHAAVMLLKLYLAQPVPAPQQVFGEPPKFVHLWREGFHLAW